MMPIGNLVILAQNGYGDNLEDVLWVIIVVVLSLLSGVGSWLRKKAGMKSEEEELEEVLGEEIIEAPEQRAPKHPPIPQARPLRREMPVPAQAAAPPVRPRPVSRQTVGTPPAIQRVPAGAPSPEPPRRPPASISSEELPTWVGVRLIEPDEAQGIVDRPIDIHAEVERHQLEEESKATVRGVAVGPLRVDDLRRAIVLKEVLGPPVSLRKPGEELWAPL